MPPPFDFREAGRRADGMNSKLRYADEYRDDFWNDLALGPILRIYAMLTHFPSDAFNSTFSEKQIADFRLYTYARLARIHQKRDGCDCMEIDGMEELVTELDLIADEESLAAIKAGEKDANRQYSNLKKRGMAAPVDH